MVTRRNEFISRHQLAVIALGCACLFAMSGQADAAETSGLAPVLIEKVSVTRQLELLQPVCESGKIAMRGDSPVCTPCPSYTSGGTGGLRINNVISGNFTRRGAVEVLADISGCEPDSAHGGGSVLLEAGDKGWNKVLYLAGFRSTECVRYRNIQQTVSLACNMSGIDRGIQNGKLKWLSLYAAKPLQQELLEWFDNSRSNPRRLVSVFPYRFLKSDFNSDGRVDLQVSVRLRDVKIPAEYASLVDAIGAGYSLDKDESLRLIYLFDGNAMTLSPNSEDGKARIDVLVKQARDH